jgi:5'-3' exonuclease
MYYRYKYIIESGRIRRLSTIIDGSSIDVSYLYYTIKSIESEIAKFKDEDVTVSICIDSYSDRKVENSDYKSNREGKLNNSDYFNLSMIEDTLKDIGYNVYKEYGAEADDLINGLVQNYHKDFDKTYIYTPDADILVNLKDDVYVYRFKTSTREHTLITPENFSELLSKEYGCDMPYNAIVLYKCLCGDKSDKIAGIKGYGAKSFDKLIKELRDEHFNFRLLSSYKNVETLLYMKKDTITGGDESKLEQALESLNLVKNRETEIVNVKPVKNLEIENNKKIIYGEKFKFYSLI